MLAVTNLQKPTCSPFKIETFIAKSMRESRNIYVQEVEEEARRTGGYARLVNGRFPEDIEEKQLAGEIVT